MVDTQLAAAPDTWMVVSTVVMAVATTVMALLTVLIWRLNKRQHQLRYEASLETVGTFAVVTNNAVRIEVLLTNQSETPAVIQSWEASLTDVSGFSQPDIGKGKLVSTKHFRAPSYVGGKGWAVTRHAPTAFSIVRQLDRPVNSANVKLKLNYVSGPTDRSLKITIPVHE